jgi:hypothetical protein
MLIILQINVLIYVQKYQIILDYKILMEIEYVFINVH